NIPVDVVTRDKDLSKYALVVAPMLYMVGDALAQGLKAYVEGGGKLVSTYISGIADETDLVHEGSFHPVLREIFGMTVTETDTLYPSDRNRLVGYGGKEYEAMDYCALIANHGAEVLAAYGGDFYQGTPAVTKNKVGEGQAYFIGARTGGDFLRDFYGELLAGLDVNAPPIGAGPGVSVQTRASSNATYYFIMNFTEEPRTFTLLQDMVDIMTGQTIAKGEHTLPVYGARICKR
ncbi:MAG: beta-galactosidase trimerization domain-containing protein, partial [Defluviitaleaceae bacterium]|nr:beta-galactosidase trimerization domain-containing protein [Defluviitaleaceae bacterium]